MARGKQRFYCRACRKFSRENPELPEGKRKYRAGKDLPSAGHLILELHAIAQEIKRTPTTSIINERSKQNRAYSLNTYYAVFGSFLTAVKRAKLKPRYKQEFDEADRERMLAELRRLRKKLKRPIFDEDVDAARRRKEVSPPYHFQRAFGSVPLAIEVAGAGKKTYSREDLIAFLRKLGAELGRPIFMKDIQESFNQGKGPSFKRILREFGTIVEARRAARSKTTARKT